jgi:sirohydrochlorin ferrochelatase
MSFILVAHGTRRPGGVAMIGGLATRVSALLHRKVQVSFVDVLGPSPSETLAAVNDTGWPSVVVPAFLSRGYHVRIDLPAHIAASAHPNVTVTRALGPGRQIARMVTARLAEAGWQPGDSVILAAAGTSDPTARADLHLAAKLLSAFTRSPVELAFAATGRPGVSDAVAAQRRRGARRVVVASYLLADGLFQERLRNSGADLVSEPLGTHPGMARLIAGLFTNAHLARRSPCHSSNGQFVGGRLRW